MERNPLEFPFQPEVETKTGLGKVFDRAKILDEKATNALLEKILKDKKKLFNRNTCGAGLYQTIGPFQFHVLFKTKRVEGGDPNIEWGYHVFVRPELAGAYGSEPLQYFFSTQLYEKDIEKMVRDSVLYVNYLKFLEKKYFDTIVGNLKDINSDFKESYLKDASVIKPKIILYPYEHKEFKKKKIKNKYIE